MDKEKDRPDEEDVKHSQYNEDAFNAMVENDEESSNDDEPDLTDFPSEEDDPQGTDEGDGDSNANSDEQPKGKADEKEEEPGEHAEQDDQQQSKDDGPELPAWMEAIPEDQRDAAVTDFLKLHEDLIKTQAKYESQTGQLKPTQRRLARLEERLKLTAPMKPSDDLSERASKIENWIKKHGEDFPDEAEELKATFDAYRDSVTTVANDANKYRSKLEESDDDDSIDQSLQRRLLERMDGSAAQISVDPNFAAYLHQHPEYAAQAKSQFAHDVIEVIDHFRLDTGWQPPMESKDFYHVNQMLVSPLFSGWSQAIGLSADQVVNFNEVDKAKVFHQFKADLDAAYQDTGSTDNEDKPEQSSNNPAAKLAAQRKNRMKDYSPPTRGTQTGGGKAEALTGEAYFDQLEI